MPAASATAKMSFSVPRRLKTCVSSAMKNDFSGIDAQALVSFKKYMPPPLPYFKVNICPLPLPHFASIIFAYL